MSRAAPFSVRGLGAITTVEGSSEISARRREVGSRPVRRVTTRAIGRSSIRRVRWRRTAATPDPPKAGHRPSTAEVAPPRGSRPARRVREDGHSRGHPLGARPRCRARVPPTSRHPPPACFDQRRSPGRASAEGAVGRLRRESRPRDRLRWRRGRPSRVRRHIRRRRREAPTCRSRSRPRSRPRRRPPSRARSITPKRETTSRSRSIRCVEPILMRREANAKRPIQSLCPRTPLRARPANRGGRRPCAPTATRGKVRPST